MASDGPEVEKPEVEKPEVEKAVDAAADAVDAAVDDAVAKVDDALDRLTGVPTDDGEIEEFAYDGRRSSPSGGATRHPPAPSCWCTASGWVVRCSPT